MSLFTNLTRKSQTVVDCLRFWGKTNPDTPAFIFWGNAGRRMLSRGEVLEFSSRFAYRLRQHGIKPRDVVCIALPNSPERVVVEFGVQLVGAVSMNGQILRADGEDLFESMIKAKCCCMVVDPEEESGAWQICKHAFDNYSLYENHVEIKSSRLPSLRKVIFSTPGSKKGFLETLQEGKKIIYENSTPQDVFSIFTTSGSTGYSKLVPHTYETFQTAYGHLGKYLDPKTGIPVFNLSPLGWIGGYPGIYLHFGCTQVGLDESCGEIPQKPAFIWNVLCTENVQVAVMTPPTMFAVNEERSVSVKNHQGHRLSAILIGGQPQTKKVTEVIGDLTDTLGFMYGATEFILGAKFDVNLTNIPSFEDNMSGYAFENTKFEIVDKELKSVPPLSRGEILIQSPTLSSGYIGAEPSAQQNFLPDGWFRTGDIGFLREDGCLFVEGRGSDAIMHGAYILYPTWLEKKLTNCPGVMKVVIVPVPDKILHHEICACVQLDDTAEIHSTAEDIIEFCKQETVLGESSSLNVIPKYVVFFTEFPQTNTNKLNRRRLADQAKERLGL